MSTPRTRWRIARRIPLLALALVALIAGLWTGLERLGIDVPATRSDLAALHGPLMVLGFLGTQIGLERAVALRRGWPYLVPVAAGAGSLWLIAGLPEQPGQALLAAGGVLLVLVFVALHRIQPSLHNTIMGLGAVTWAVGASAWLLGATLVRVVPWLAAFLILTIVGERLELSRAGRLGDFARAVLSAAVAACLAGVALSMEWPDPGIRLAGAGLLAQALWLSRYDIARRTIRMRGAARYMATALITGYLWLAVAATLWIWNGAPSGGGYAYDAMLHAIFVGFVFSMILAHAPVIVPAILSVKLPFRRGFWVPLAVLHAGLIARMAGAAIHDHEVWRLGGVMNEMAIALFLALAVASAVRARHARNAVAFGTS